MNSWPRLALLCLCALGCEGGQIAIFSTAVGGGAGTSGAFDAAGMAGALAGTGGASPGGSGGADDSGAGAPPSGTGIPIPCQSTADCDRTSFCSKQSCADDQGVCLPVPFPDETVSAYVCGCDKITYWNDSFRRYYGVSASTMGVCNQDRRTCMHNQDCLSRDAVCAHLLPPNVSCGTPPGLGLCWIIPNGCPRSDPQRFLICPPPGSGMPASCASTCQAIQSGHPFLEAHPGQTCP